MFYGVRFGLVTLTGFVVIMVPKFANLMSLIGATCCTTLAFIMPGLCHLCLFRRELTKSQLLLDYFLVFIGFLSFIVGTIDTVKTMQIS